MKKGIKYILLLLLTASVVGCSSDEQIVTPLENLTIEAAAEGGEHIRDIVMSGNWIASTDNTWISVSPANGKGREQCTFIIDSALTVEPRRGVVRIQNVDTWEQREIVVEQQGFPYQIEVEDNLVELKNYDKFDSRYFDVKIRSNVDFTISIPDNVSWVESQRFELKLDRGLRPREVNVRFKWDINTTPKERLAEILFTPKQDVELLRCDKLNIKQEAAEPIVENSRSGDSVALLSISRALQMYTSWDASLPMDMWNNITLWDESMEGCTPEKVGRVRRAEFFLFNTREKLPYEVRYLTAADELYFFGNTNTFMLSLELGEDICELKQLKRLTLGSYGLTSLPMSLSKLENLEYLNVGSNNFQRIPDVITKENFPKLRSLIMNANQRSSVYDLSNSVRTDLGGFIDEPEFPVELIKWGLDTLVLSVNYLHGSLPDFEDDPDIPYYTQEEIDAVDSLPQILVDRKIKKVMPTTKRFAINLNRLSGKLPDWLLYHPALDWWIPYSLVFPQDGRAKDGTQAIFENEPANLNYYYDVYTTKEKPTGDIEE